MKNKILFCILFIFLFLILFSDLLADDLVLGQSAPFEGSSSALGTELWKGSNAYFSYINDLGGVQGKKIKVIALNDGYEGKKTLQNTIDLVLKNKVFALYGYVGTPTIVEALPAIQKFSKDGMFLFSNFTGARPQREKPHSDYVFNVRASYRQETAGLVENLYKLKKRRFGLFLQFDAYGRAGAAGVRRALSEKKISVVAETTYQRGAKFEDSMYEQVKEILKTNADVVISVGSYEASAAFIRDARNAGFKGIIANLSFVGPEELLKLLIQEEVKTKFNYTKNLVNSQVVPSPNDTTYELVKEYINIMNKYSVSFSGVKEDKSFQPSFTSLEGFLNAKVFVKILKQIPGKITRESFVESIKKSKKLNIGLGKTIVDFNNLSSQGLNSIFYTTIKNGAHVTLNNWNEIH